MYLVEIILTFQTACATNLDLTFGVGFYNQPNEKYLYKEQEWAAQKGSEKCRFGGKANQEKKHHKYAIVV